MPHYISSSFSGSKERKIPVPTENPFTGLFRFVSCPNYTYEVSTSECSIFLYLRNIFLFILGWRLDGIFNYDSGFTR